MRKDCVCVRERRKRQFADFIFRCHLLHQMKEKIEREGEVYLIKFNGMPILSLVILFLQVRKLRTFYVYIQFLCYVLFFYKIS